MRILFTGASSFTGFWLVNKLAEAGHEITATFTRTSPDDYTAVRRRRVEHLLAISRPLFAGRFGEDDFLAALGHGGPWDVLCHHAAETRDYRSPDFDVPAAVESNTKNISRILETLARKGLKSVVCTGSVFEAGEGFGSDGLRDFSPYGVSKRMSFEIVKNEASARKIPVGKFVIPNPFGPLEEFRFTSSLAKTWFEGRTAEVKTPLYIRDNIHVGLLGASYAYFVNRLGASGNEFLKLNPSGYAESIGAFARRFSAELSKRLGVPCEYELKHQTDFSEPRQRINTDPASLFVTDWEETKAWDDLAEYYRAQFKK